MLLLQRPLDCTIFIAELEQFAVDARGRFIESLKFPFREFTKLVGD
jgi:hypothetical protein